MSTSEQELRGQIAGMREALRSARASARTGKIVGTLGVIVGLGIVACYVYAFITMGKDVAQPAKFVPIIRERVERLEIENTLKKVVEEAAPVYLQEGRDLLKDMDLFSVAKEQFELARADVQPLIQAELERVAPKLQEILLAQKDETLKEMQASLEKKLGDRVTAAIQRQETTLGGQFNEETLAVIVANLQNACLDGLRKVVEDRTGNVKAEMDKIVKIVAQLPELPESPREDVLHEMVIVLLSLTRDRLPEYPDVSLDKPARGEVNKAPKGMSQEEAWAKEGAEAQRQAAEAMKKREAGNE